MKQFNDEERSYLISNMTKASLGTRSALLARFCKKIIERLSFNVEDLNKDQSRFVLGIMEAAEKRLSDEDKKNPDKRYDLVLSIKEKLSKDVSGPKAQSAE